MPSQGSVRGLAAASLIALATLVVDHFHRLPVVAVALAGACALAVTLRLLRGLAETARSAHATGLARDQAVEASIAKSAFVATVSHELRTPLSGVIGMTELLLETPLSMEQREYTEIVRSSGEGMLLVINDILDYSKIEAGKLDLDESTFALRETVAAGCAALLVIAQNKGIELDVLNDSDLPQWVRGDAGRLRQVVINLVANAVKFTDVGHVTVRLVATRPEGARGDRVRVRVEVSDTGIGIDAPTLARLFQPFTQGERSTARTYGGTGLGLTISARLVQMMGGTIGATSNPGEGSTFWFELPLRSAEARPPARSSQAWLYLRGKGLATTLRWSWSPRTTPSIRCSPPACSSGAAIAPRSSPAVARLSGRSSRPPMRQS